VRRSHHAAAPVNPRHWSVADAQPLELEATTVNMLESSALRYQDLYHSTDRADDPGYRPP
jgi:hypothetical protein